MVTVGTLLARMDGFRGHMGWDHDRPGWRIAIMIVLFALLIGVAVWAVVRATRASHAPTAPPAGVSNAGSAARDILDQRFARGEIDSTEYEERRRVLGS